MKIEPAEPFSIKQVALQMRDRDLVEFSAVNKADTREELAELAAARFGWHPEMWTAGLDEPLCVFGVVRPWPNVVTLTFFARPDFERIALPFTKYVTRELFPQLFAEGVHRIQCFSISHYAPVHRWLETLGLRREGSFPHFGKRGETFDCFALTRIPNARAPGV